MIRNLLADNVNLRRALFVLACSFIGIALAAQYAAQSPATYQASATVFVGSVTPDEAQQKVLTLAQLATSDVVIERVIATTGLDETPPSLRPKVSAEAVPQTVLIRISAQDQDREQAREIANTVALELEVYAAELNEQVAGSDESTTARLVDPALTPDEPISPRPAIVLGLGLVGGLAGGLILTAALARRDDLLRTEGKVEQVTDTPSLGSVPRVRGRRLTPIDVATHPATVQSFKGLRNNLVQRLPATSNPVVAMVSSGPEEGKTCLTLGLARALADDGRSVLIVDGDLREHVLTSVLDLGARPGWVNSLEESIHPSELVIKDALESVDVVAVGPRVPRNRSGKDDSRLDFQTLQRVLDALRGSYDVVLIDTANLDTYADSALISRHADGAVLVVPSGQVGPRQVTLAMESVVKAGGEVLGTVLNFAARSTRV